MRISNRHLSLRGLRTFCAAARHASFRLAAEDLFITASAVSHQIKRLEDELRVRLFDRNGRGLKLTPAGESLKAGIDPLIRQLDEVAGRFREQYQRRSLRISVQPFFASELFVPRLGEFTTRHPQVDVTVDTSDESLLKHPAAADVSIRLFRSPPAELGADRIFPLRLVAACAPDLAEQIGPGPTGTREPFPLILHASRPEAWRRWVESAEIEVPTPTKLISLDTMSAAVRAAEQGLGVALVPVPMSDSRFASRTLVKLYPNELLMEESYYVVYPKDLDDLAEIQTLREWVLQNFATDA